MRALIIEDDHDTADYIKERLEEKCFSVDLATTGDQGIILAKTTTYDLVLLDYILPKRNGLEVCLEIRSQSSSIRRRVPIILISVSQDLSRKVASLEAGVDDYLTKPFFFDELFARIQAVLRRPPLQETTIFRIDDLVLDINAHKVTRGMIPVYLTKKEFSLLEFLMRHVGQVVSRGAITEHVWDMNIDVLSNTIEMHILNLRKKLEMSGKTKLIHSIPGRGYKIDITR